MAALNGTQVDRRQIGTRGDCEQADEDRGRIEPAREKVAGGVSDGHTAGGDAPTAAPSANGVSTDEIPNSVSIVRCSCPADAPARRVYAAPRTMIPTAAMKSAKLRVHAIEPNAAGYAVQTTVITKISQTW
jgi:hypothetical protein